MMEEALSGTSETLEKIQLSVIVMGITEAKTSRTYTILNQELREVGDVLFLRKVVPVWYPSIGARGRNTLLIARQTTRRPAVFAIPGLPHLAVFSVGIDGSVIHNSLLKQVVTGHDSLGDHDSSVIPSSEGAQWRQVWHLRRPPSHAPEG